MGLNAIKLAKPKAALLDDYSLEMTAEDVAGLEEARHQIPTRTSISVAFLPGEDLEVGVRAAGAIKRLGLVSVPHISARRLGSADELETFLQRPGPERGIDRAFVIAGAHGAVRRCAGVIRSGALVRHGIRLYPFGGLNTAARRADTVLAHSR